MGRIFFFGGMGAVVNSAIALHSSSYSIENLVSELLVQPFSAVRTLLPAALGFLFGTAILLIWSFIQAMVVRFLLDYNGWFLNPKSPINKVWYLLMLLFLGKKNLGAGNYQLMLPTLPVPSLKKTCKRYLDSVRPLLSPEDYRVTESAVTAFQNKEGKRLQFYLKLRSWTHRNWISDWWMEYVYLKQRTPIPFNSNYYALGNLYPPTKSQLDRAAMFMHLACKYKKELVKGTVDNMVAQKLVPFCMDGTKYTTNTCRIPHSDVDEIKVYPHTQIHHDVVIRQGKMYKIQVTTRDGRIFPPSLIKKQLEKVIEMAGDELDETGVMSFTAQSRPKWAEIRERMCKDPINKESLECIESAYHVYILENDSAPPEAFTTLCQKVFHGNVYNRWFDKSISVTVFENGLVGCNVEHAPLDATVGGQFWEYMLLTEAYDENGIALQKPEAEKGFPTSSEPEELRWNMNGFEDDLKESKEHLQAMIDDSDLIILCPSYGKRFPKRCRLSPDGYFQMALQLTYYRIHHCFVLTYESATTRLYYKGRTETIRPVSEHSKVWVEAMEDPTKSVEERKDLLKEAIKYQERYKFEAMRGMGIDRHLFGLYVIAKWLNVDPLPRLFQDKAFQMQFQLSTSQTPVQFVFPCNVEKCSVAGGFGTVVEDGYGVSYLVVGEDKVYFSIHSKRSCPTTSSQKFADTLYQSFEDMKALYEPNISTQ